MTNPNTPMINCKLAAGESICAVCGSMVPDYCLKKSEPSPIARALAEVRPPVPQSPFVDHYGIVTGAPEVLYVDTAGNVTDALQEPEATQVPEEVPAPVVEAPKVATKRGRKKRGGN